MHLANPSGGPAVVLEARQSDEQAAEIEGQALLAELDDPDITALVGGLPQPVEIELAPTEPAPQRHPADVFAERVRQRLFAAAAEADEASAEENLRRLENLSGKLNRVSSEQTVDEMAVKFHQWLGTKKRAQQPADAAAGEFDSTTAQYHDVRREKNADGTVRYLAVLVDAEGRTMTVELEEADGESAYRTMQLLKANPLAEMVYRRILMSLLDKVIDDRAPPPSDNGPSISP
jgi:hypothetical protein